MAKGAAIPPLGHEVQLAEPGDAPALADGMPQSKADRLSDQITATLAQGLERLAPLARAQRVSLMLLRPDQPPAVVLSWENTADGGRIQPDGLVAPPLRPGILERLNEGEIVHLNDPGPPAEGAATLVPICDVDGLRGLLLIEGGDPLTPEMDERHRILRGLAVMIQTVLDRHTALQRAATERRRLQAERAMLDRILQTSITGIITLDDAGRFTFANDIACRILHLDRDDTAGHELAHILRHGRGLDGQPLTRADLPLDTVLETGDPVYDIRLAFDTGEGVQRILSFNAAPIEDLQIDGASVAFTLTDVTESTRTEAVARETAAQLQSLFQLTLNGIVMLELDSMAPRRVNPALCRMLQMDEDTLLEGGLARLFADQGEAFTARLSDALGNGNGEGFGPEELDLRRANGSKLRVSLFAVAVPHRSDGGTAWIIIEDVSEARAESERLLYEARHDSLTGMPNRKYFLQQLKQEIATRETAGGFGAVVLIDLDKFKEVNDTHGHPAGDAYLITLSKWLCGALRGREFAARFGGDEFAVILPEITSARHAKLRAMEISEAMSRSVHLGPVSAKSSVSIGVALYPIDARDADELLLSADSALYISKRAGGGMVSFHKPGTPVAKSAQHDRLLSDIGHAAERNELTMRYQPIVDLRSGEVRIFEALLRWNRPGREPVMPSEFIRLAETNSAIDRLRRYCIDEALRRQRQWSQEHGPVRVAVNLSPAQIATDSALEWILGRLNTPETREALVLEITETTSFRDSAQYGRLHRLRDAGIQIAIDDFGTGYSTLDYLARIPADYLKLDQTFVAGLHELKYRRLVRASISLGHEFGMKVVAEGVENAQQLDFLRAHGCDLAQGFLFGNPVPPSEVDFARYAF